MTMTTISAHEFARRRAQGAHVLDVRTPAEHAGLHVEGAVCCPVGELQTQVLLKDLQASGFAAGDKLYLLCQAGRRAQMAAEQIARESDIDVVVVEGGTDACVLAGLPTRQGGRRVISLERQVRIAAGVLVLSGAVLGGLLSPAWYLLSGAVGAGLMFAGITDTCAMGMLLARMPWNRA